MGTVNVRIPDVRFGYPDENMSGFRIIRLSDVRFIQLCPVIGRLLYLKRPITGHKRPVIGRLLYLKRPITGYNVRLSDVYCISNVWKPDITSGFQTLDVLEPKPVPKPVPNRFQTGFGRFRRSKSGYNVRISTIQAIVSTNRFKTGSEPFLEPVTSEIRTKLSGYRTFGQLASSDNRTVMSGYRTSECIQSVR